jgi:hypothetical protein
MDVADIPQRTMIKDSHVDGASFFKIRFEGISKRMYGIKKMKRAILYRPAFFPSMSRSLVIPWIFAFPVQSSVSRSCCFIREGRTNVCAIKKGQQEQDEQGWKNTNVALSQQLFLRHRIDVRSMSVVDHLNLLIGGIGLHGWLGHDGDDVKFEGACAQAQ